MQSSVFKRVGGLCKSWNIQFVAIITIVTRKRLQTFKRENGLNKIFNFVLHLLETNSLELRLWLDDDDCTRSSSAGKAISLPCHAKLGNIRDNDERPKLGARSNVQKSLPLGLQELRMRLETQRQLTWFLKSFHIYELYHHYPCSCSKLGNGELFIDIFLLRIPIIMFTLNGSKFKVSY